MDDPSIASGEIDRTLDELEVINRFLGGYRPSLAGVASLLPRGCRGFSLLDVGTGCGDFLRRLARWASRRRIDLEATGIDISEATVRHAIERSQDVSGVAYEAADIFSMSTKKRFDIVHAGMVLHHFDDADASRALAKMFALCRKGVVVNDIHRHPLAYHGIRLLTRAFSRSRLIRNDAPLSVLRAFRRRELEELVRRAGLAPPRIRWRLHFRWQVVIPR